MTTRTYDETRGFVTSIQTGTGGNDRSVQDQSYAYDAIGQLYVRHNRSEQVFESFTYDWLNRLTRARVYGPQGTQVEDKRYTYDALGNIVTKSDVGASAYVYGTGNGAGAGDAGPHAVVSAGGHAYAYDDNGNMVSGAGRTLGWTSYNKPRSITTSTTTSTFEYGAERQRIRQVQVQGATTTSTTYVGAVFEQVAKTGEATRRVHYIHAGGERVAVYTTDDAPAPVERLRYLHTDHLGSVDTITDESGVVVERLSYDAFGKRRVATGAGAWGDAALPLAAVETSRGFTGHEHLDALALVHMNGRVYDPVLGRFLSADPFVQAPESTQGLNRYSYALNNPLSLIDPSGYFFKSIFRAARKVVRSVVKVFKSVARNPLVQTVATIAAGAACGPGCAAAASGVFTAVSGGDLGDVIKAAAVTYVSVRAFAKVDSAFKGTAPTIANRVGRSVAHGAVGGLAAKASGGQFRHGFLATAVTQFAAPSVSKIGSRAGREFALAALGGTAAELGGGKFANGARTAAYLSLFSWAAEHYENTVGWAADPSPGGKLYGEEPGECCNYDSDDWGGRTPGPEYNVIGMNKPRVESFWADVGKQGGSLGNALNVVPGMNAAAHYHDVRLNVWDAEGVPFNAFTNFGTMPPAAAVSYGALVGNLVQGWESDPLAWDLVSRPDDDD